VYRHVSVVMNHVHRIPHSGPPADRPLDGTQRLAAYLRSATRHAVLPARLMLEVTRSLPRTEASFERRPAE
jgi:hypothetical protein